MRVSCLLFILLSTILPSTAAGAAEIRYDNWMGDLDEGLRKTVPINYLSIPGAHDSGTYDVDSRVANDLVADTWNDVINKVKALFSFIPVGLLANLLFDDMKSSWARTQKHRISEQLAMGARFFDIRLSHPNEASKASDIRIVHGSYGPQFTEILADMRDFLNAHPKEVIIVSMLKLFNMDGSWGELEAMLESHFTGKLLNKSHNPQPNETFTFQRLTLDLLSASGVQVILMGDFGDKMERIDIFAGMTNVWPNTYDAEEVLNIQKNRLEDRPTISSSIYVSQYVVTKDGTTMINVIVTPIVDLLPAPLLWAFEGIWSSFKKAYPLEDATRHLKDLISSRKVAREQWKINNVILFDFLDSDSLGLVGSIIWANNVRNLPNQSAAG